AERSDRAPLALSAPVRSASSHSSRPVASLYQVSGSVSTTFGGVPRVWRGPATACTAATGTTLISTERPGLALSSRRSRNRAADLRAARSGSAPDSSALATTATLASPSGSGLRAGMSAEDRREGPGPDARKLRQRDLEGARHGQGVARGHAEDRGGDAVLRGQLSELPLPAGDDRDQRAGGGLAEQGGERVTGQRHRAAPAAVQAGLGEGDREASVGQVVRAASRPSAAAAVTRIASRRSASRSTAGG